MGKQKGKRGKNPNKKQRENRKERGNRKYNDQQWRSEKFRLKQQIGKFGLDIKEIGGDGNCLFRAISDQINGNEEFHKEYRELAVEFMKNNRDDFEPFIEDDEKFEDYLKRMSKSSVWGGNLELQALSRVLGVDIKIHRLGQPIWEIVNYGEGRSIHLSYHDGDHYNSVRLKSNMHCDVPTAIPEVLIIEETQDQYLDSQFTTCAEYFIENFNEGNLEEIVQALKKVYQNPPDFDEILNDYGKISEELYNGEKTKKANEIKEEKKNTDVMKHLGKRPANLPGNKKKCWCGSGKVYKNCCKSLDHLREVEEEKVVTKMESLQI